MRFVLLDGEAKLGECELNLAQYATLKSVEGGENPSESIALPFQTEAPFFNRHTLAACLPACGVLRDSN